MNLPQPLHIRIARWFQRWRWAAITGGRYGFGRWYVLRDAPDWFVNEVADCPDEVEDEFPSMAAYVREARAEMQRRFNRLIRRQA